MQIAAVSSSSPKMMTFRNLLVSAALVLGAQAHLRQNQPRDLMAMAFEEYHAYLFSTVNAFRVNHSLPALCRTEPLMTSANTTVNLVAFAGELNRNVEGTTTESRVRGGGYQGLAVDELFAADGFQGDDKGSASSAFKQWKATPEAKAKVLGNFTAAGTGKAMTPDGTVFYVLHLGQDKQAKTCDVNGHRL